MTKAPTNERLEDEPPKDPGLPQGMPVGEYVVDRKIGEGAFGAVYAAEHPVIGKRAAIKVLARRFSGDEEVVSRFVSEARAVNRIRHRNIVDIFAFGQLENGQPYLVMEYLEGSTLRDFIEARGIVSIEDAVPVLRGVADALDAAHDQGIVHRDLKPDNVFLARERKNEMIPKLLDFGVAKLQRENSSHKTATGIAVGTPLYMSPEQCRGRSVDHRSDIYAFGAMIYEMLTGQPPFDGETVMDIMVKHMNEPAQAMSRVAPHLPRELDDPVLVMLAKKASARPASTGLALASLVEAARRAGSSVPKYEPSLSSRVMDLVQTEAALAPNANLETKKVKVGEEIDLPTEVPSLRSGVPSDSGGIGSAVTRAATPPQPYPSLAGRTTAPISSEAKALDVGLQTPHQLPRRTATAPAGSAPPDSPSFASRKHMTLEAIEAPTSPRATSLPIRVAVAIAALAIGVGVVWLIQSMRTKTEPTVAGATTEATTRRIDPTYQPNINAGAAPPTTSVVLAAPSVSAPAPSASVSASSAPTAPTPVVRTPNTVKPPVTAAPSSTDKGNLGAWN